MDYFEKKQWLRLIICAVVVIAIVLLVTGVIGGKNLTFNRTETTDVTEKGFGGDVTLHVSREGNIIRKIVIDTPDETEGLGKKASGDEFIGQFLDKEGPFAYGTDDIEAISGATVTSEAVLRGLNSLYGVTEKKTEETAEESETAEVTKAPEEYAFKSEQETNFSIIRVYADAADGKITDCLIESEDKPDNKDFLTDEIRSEWAKAIAENGTAETDVITGASLTFSSKAVIDAVKDIQSQISKPDEEEKKAAAKVLYGGYITRQETQLGLSDVIVYTKSGKIDNIQIIPLEKDQEPAGDTQDTPAEAPKTEEPAESAQGLYGSFMVEKETDFSIIRVYADTKDGKITKCIITSEGKSEGSDFLTDEIKDEWAKAIVESGTAETDVITSATKKFSAAAVTEAVNEILAKGSTPVTTEATKDETQEEPKEGPKEELKAEEPAESTQELYGSFMVKKETDYSIIRVYIDTKDGKITGCRITSEGKSESSDFLTDEIKTEWAKAIVENGTAETDAITGATLKLSSKEVVDAVNEVLEKIK